MRKPSWQEGSPPIVVYSSGWDSGQCAMCGESITPETRRAYLHSPYKRYGTSYICAYQVCPHCEIMNFAIIEAEQEQRRFTTVCVGKHETHFGYYFGERCLCGASTIQRMNLCVRCWRESRMLSTAQRKINAIKKMTTQLNKEIKERQNGTQ